MCTCNMTRWTINRFKNSKHRWVVNFVCLRFFFVDVVVIVVVAVLRRQWQWTGLNCHVLLFWLNDWHRTNERRQKNLSSQSQRHISQECVMFSISLSSVDESCIFDDDNHLTFHVAHINKETVTHREMERQTEAAAAIEDTFRRIKWIYQSLCVSKIHSNI